jgi:hypothetical protein
MCCVGRLGEPGGDLFGGECTAEEVALGAVAPVPSQDLERVLVLDALGDDCHAEVVREVDRRADDDCVAGDASEI